LDFIQSSFTNDTAVVEIKLFEIFSEKQNETVEKTHNDNLLEKIEVSYLFGIVQI